MRRICSSKKEQLISKLKTHKCHTERGISATLSGDRSVNPREPRGLSNTGENSKVIQIDFSVPTMSKALGQQSILLGLRSLLLESFPRLRWKDRSVENPAWLSFYVQMSFSEHLAPLGILRKLLDVRLVNSSLVLLHSLPRTSHLKITLKTRYQDRNDALLPGIHPSHSSW